MNQNPYSIEFQDGEWWVIENILTPRRTKGHSADRQPVQEEADWMNAIFGCWSMRGRGLATSRVHKT